MMVVVVEKGGEATTRKGRVGRRHLRISHLHDRLMGVNAEITEREWPTTAVTTPGRACTASGSRQARDVGHRQDDSTLGKLALERSADRIGVPG